MHKKRVLISDFGVSKKGFEMASTQVGSPLYSAPEVLTYDFYDNSKNFYDSKSDIWSIGCVLYEMLTGKTPFFGTTVSEILRDIKTRAKGLAM